MACEISSSAPASTRTGFVIAERRGPPADAPPHPTPRRRSDPRSPCTTLELGKPLGEVETLVLGKRKRVFEELSSAVRHQADPTGEVPTDVSFLRQSASRLADVIIDKTVILTESFMWLPWTHDERAALERADLRCCRVQARRHGKARYFTRAAPSAHALGGDVAAMANQAAGARR